MTFSHVGEISALATAICWSITAMVFESASRKVGSLVVNLIRIILAFIFLSLLNFLRCGSLLPINADMHNWIWLLLSGLVGFVLGDMFLFESYTIIGARISALIMTLVPLMTAFIGWIIMKETMSLFAITGMFLTLSGIFIVLFRHEIGKSRFRLNHSRRGIVYAFIGAVGQSAGLVLSKYGMKSYDPFMATEIRTIAGIFGFSIIFLFLKRWHHVTYSLSNKPALTRILFGSIFGPFLGVSLSLISIQHTTTGIASTIMAMVPILIIPPSIIFLKQKVTLNDVIGAIISVIGVSMFFIE